MTDTKKRKTTNGGKDMGKNEIVPTVGGNVNQSNHYRCQYGGFSKN
jgi:hypothetical protein